MLSLPFNRAFYAAYEHCIAKRLFFSKSKSKIAAYNTVTPGIVSSELSIPEHIEKPDYYLLGEPTVSNAHGSKPEIKSANDIKRLKESCHLAATILHKCRGFVDIGITTDEIDRFVHHEIVASNAYPSPLRYNGFPKSVCTSVNNVACHGIPDNRALMDGDILNIDVTVYLNGFHGDCSDMYLIGNVDERSRFLVDVTRNCLNNAIALCGPEVPFNVIGNVIDRTARQNGLCIVPAFTGHGIGSYFHGPPEILHFNNCEPGLMAAGMAFTIEPVVSLGSEEIEIQEDGWTAMSVDNSRSAQIEHTILITSAGHEILTKV